MRDYVFRYVRIMNFCLVNVRMDYQVRGVFYSEAIFETSVREKFINRLNNTTFLSFAL